MHAFQPQQTVIQPCQFLAAAKLILCEVTWNKERLIKTTPAFAKTQRLRNWLNALLTHYQTPPDPRIDGTLTLAVIESLQKKKLLKIWLTSLIFQMDSAQLWQVAKLNKTRRMQRMLRNLYITSKMLARNGHIKVINRRKKYMKTISLGELLT